MAKKEETNEVNELVMDRMPGADAISEEETKPFEVDLNFEEEPKDEEPENEEVSEETNSLAEEEVVEEESEQQKEEEKSPEPEASSEEVVDGESEDAPQPDIQPAEGSDEHIAEEVNQQKPPMVPKSRLDEVLAKQKALQKQLDQYTKAQEEAQQHAPDYDFATKEAEYQTLVLDGEAEKAVLLRNEIRQAEKDQFMFEVQQKMGQTVQQNQEITELQAKAAEIQATFPILDENSVDYDVDLQNEVLALRDAFISQGYVPADALTKATEYTLAAKKPELLRPEPSPKVNNEDKKVQELKQKANVSKKLEAASSQPPQMAGESAGSKNKNVDIHKLSEQEFGALPEETLRRLRGDFG
jgi:hypothetical protein